MDWNSGSIRWSGKRLIRTDFSGGSGRGFDASEFFKLKSNAEMLDIEESQTIMSNKTSLRSSLPSLNLHTTPNPLEPLHPSLPPAKGSPKDTASA